MALPMTTDDIINLPMDEFNERLSKFDLTEAQLSLIRDIRRRGKNKVAAQNCRKRKLDQIHQLEDEVQKIRERKQALKREQDGLRNRRDVLKDRYAQLYRTVFQALRDPDGNPYSQYEYSLQQAADGNIVLVPRNLTQPSTSGNSDSINPANPSRRDKSKDDMKKEGQS
jgi:nuclear factor erythroid 2